MKRAAQAIDLRLKSDPTQQTIIHGDPKTANMLFLKQHLAGNTNRMGSENKEEHFEWIPQVYDYQYIGISNRNNPLEEPSIIIVSLITVISLMCL